MEEEKRSKEGAAIFPSLLLSSLPPRLIHQFINFQLPKKRRKSGEEEKKIGEEAAPGLQTRLDATAFSHGCRMSGERKMGRRVGGGRILHASANDDAFRL